MMGCLGSWQRVDRPRCCSAVFQQHTFLGDVVFFRDMLRVVHQTRAGGCAQRILRRRTTRGCGCFGYNRRPSTPLVLEIFFIFPC